MSSALFPLALAVVGLPVVVGGVALTARALVYRHAEQCGPAIRAAGRDDANAATFRAVHKAVAPTPRRPKELTHR